MKFEADFFQAGNISIPGGDILITSLVLENSANEKNKYINFSEMKMEEYLNKNFNSQITKKKNIRSKTLDIKVWNEWKYEDNVCCHVIYMKKQLNIFSIVEHMKTVHKKLIGETY